MPATPSLLTAGLLLTIYLGQYDLIRGGPPPTPVEIGLGQRRPSHPAGVNWDSGLGTSEGKRLSHGLSPWSEHVEVIQAAATRSRPTPSSPHMPLCPPGISGIPRQDTMRSHIPSQPRPWQFVS